MKIKVITKYGFKGEEFKTLKEVQDRIHNIIGEEVIDKINKNCDVRHKDLFKMLDILCSPEVRKTLLECLNNTIENEDEETINILDLKFKK